MTVPFPMIWVFSEVAVFTVMLFSSVINEVIHVTSEMERGTRVKDPVHSVHVVLSSEIAHHVRAANNILYIGYNTCGINCSMCCVIP